MGYQELQGAATAKAAPCGAGGHHVYICGKAAATTSRVSQRMQFALSMVLCLVVLPGLFLALLGLLGTAVSCGVAASRGGSASTCLWHAVTHWGGPAGPPWRLPVPPDEKRVYSSRCIRAIGGGTVGPRGNFVHPVPECEAELREYLDGGAYDAEVEEVAGAAITYFSAPLAARFAAGGAGAATPYDLKLLVVFDIDETALSNRATFFPSGARSGAALNSLGRPGCGHGAGAAASGSSSLALLVPELADGDAAGAARRLQRLRPQQQYAPLKNTSSRTTPALQPVLRFYLALRASGFHVAFLTGRSEAARDATAANLAAVGYGRSCADADGGPSAAAASSSAEAPCYEALLLREDGDVRLASVYKPAKRAELEAAGYVIAGNIGDQLSDLVGASSGLGSFLLPNPFYTLL